MCMRQVAPTTLGNNRKALRVLMTHMTRQSISQLTLGDAGELFQLIDSNRQYLGLDLPRFCGH